MYFSFSVLKSPSLVLALLLHETGKTDLLPYLTSGPFFIVLYF